MKKSGKLSLIAIPVAVVIIAVSSTFSGGEVDIYDQLFPDVQESHWGYDAISWGYQEEIISGFPDGSYKPSQELTEAEFIRMLSSYVGDKIRYEWKESDIWYEPFYEFAQYYNWNVPSFEDDSKRGEPIRRGDVARILYDSYKFHDRGEEEAIKFLLESGISSGKEGKTLEGYKADDSLTRAEAIQFMYMYKDNEPVWISGGDWDPLVVEEYETEVIVEVVEVEEKELDKLLSSKKEENFDISSYLTFMENKGYEISQSSSGSSFVKGEKISISVGYVEDMGRTIIATTSPISEDYSNILEDTLEYLESSLTYKELSNQKGWKEHSAKWNFLYSSGTEEFNALRIII